MGGGSQAACDETVFPTDTYYGERQRLQHDYSYSDYNGWSQCAARDNSISYICKVLV
jgi:hypothetical protein